MTTLSPPQIYTSTLTVPATTTSTQGNYTYSSIGAGGGGNITSSQFTIGNGVSCIYQQTPPSIISFYSPDTSQEIVKMKLDGSVEWRDDIDIDAAAEAFSRSLILGAEQSAGITQRVKLEMRDSVFKDIINIAREKGSLTAEDLTYLLEASKIVEKLKGGN